MNFFTFMLILLSLFLISHLIEPPWELITWTFETFKSFWSHKSLIDFKVWNPWCSWKILSYWRFFIIGNKLTIDVTSSTPDLYYYCSTHYPSGNGMGNEISTVPFGMPADIEDMLGLMKNLYEGEDSDSGQAGVQINDMDALKGILENAAINGSGDGSVKGLSKLLNNLDPTTDLSAEAGVQSLQNIVSQEIAQGMTEFNNQTPGAAGNKTIDEIFKETIEDTIDELETHIPEAFSGS